MYDGKTQLLVANPINRYLINSPILPGLKENPDGALTLYIQKDSPGDVLHDLTRHLLFFKNSGLFIKNSGLF